LDQVTAVAALNNAPSVFVLISAALLQNEDLFVSFLKERGRSSPGFVVGIDVSSSLSAAVFARRAAHACLGGQRSCGVADPFRVLAVSAPSPGSPAGTGVWLSVILSPRVEAA
jgi:hypothetical protein